jgi:hypothetical protein
MNKLTFVVGENINIPFIVYDQIIHCSKNMNYDNLESGIKYLLMYPEVELYPSHQINMAENLVKLFLKLKQDLIIITHSEYIIRTIQLIIARKRNRITPEMIEICCFTSDKVLEEEEESCEAVYISNINSDGSFTKNLPKGFMTTSGFLDLKLYQIAR